MLNFSELKKVFKFNYSNFFKSMYPMGYKRVLTENSFNNFITSFIFLFIGYLISFVTLLDITRLPLGDVNTLGVKTSGIDIFALLLVIVPIVMLVYILVNKGKEDNGKFIYWYFVISLVLIMFLLFRVITWIGILSISTFDGICGLVSIIVCLIGYGFLDVASMEHLVNLKRDYLAYSTQVKNVDIKTSTISVDDVSMH